MDSTGSIKVSYFVAIYFSVYACHSRANLPKGKAVSVCEIYLNPNKICEGNSLNFSLGQIRPGMTSIHQKINSHKIADLARPSATKKLILQQLIIN